MRLPKVRGGARSRLLSSSTTSAFSPNPPRPKAVATATKGSSFPFPSSMASPSFSMSSPRLLLRPPSPFSPYFLALFSSTTLSPSPSGPGRRNESDETEEEEWIVEWEEEEVAEPMIGDGGDGGGIVLGDVGWGERALSVAHEILQLHFSDDMVIYAFKVSPRGYIYVRLDKLTNKYGCPAMEEIENFSSLYKKQLDEIVECGEIPLDLALEVSSPGAERLLKVPKDLDRFKLMPMRVQYLEENLDSKHHQQKDGVFILESIDSDTACCVWKLADVKENRAEVGKGRPLSRKQKDWRLRLPFESVKRVTFYLN
ncbi:hypothetical protein COCNU_06G020010 [Cocos nucifera]|uniref:DUF7912 domain-containing protein n=1 Tax=Cocos nucifera TaxID=13894 RepID=A0A8K0N4K4_COCNU|nr:hypothetical protein COCNU_06G020010 [Cocos nucifera]